jgi:hypothetical protein
MVVGFNNGKLFKTMMSLVDPVQSLLSITLKMSFGLWRLTLLSTIFHKKYTSECIITSVKIKVAVRSTIPSI